MVNAADDIWEVKKNEGWVQKESVFRIVNIAGSMHIPWDDRISSVAFLFSDMKKQEINVRDKSIITTLSSRELSSGWRSLNAFE